jgi:hypothetical protein
VNGIPAHIEFNARQFTEALEDAAEVIADGLVNGLHGALDNWRIEARNIAPLDKGTLRRGFGENEISGSGLDLTGEFAVVATERSRRGQRFNYAYYIHEKNMGGKSLRHPGTEKKFLDVALERNDDRWKKQIEDDIQDELRRRGW